MPRRKEVDDWFARHDNPMKPVLQRVREIILTEDMRIDECIKWKAPPFTFAGNLASFFPRSMQHASLMFHTGASIPGTHPRLQGGGGTSKLLRIASVDEANAARRDIEAIVRAWCDWKAAGAGAAQAVKKTAAASGENAANQKVVKQADTSAKKKGGESEDSGLQGCHKDREQDREEVMPQP